MDVRPVNSIRTLSRLRSKGYHFRFRYIGGSGFWHACDEYRARQFIRNNTAEVRAYKE